MKTTNGYDFWQSSKRCSTCEDRVLSVRLRRKAVTLFLLEIGQARIRRTEVRPICRRRAISALLIPAR